MEESPRNIENPRTRFPVSGPGALCSEAQSDGVPCGELGRDCEQCERAVRVFAEQADDPPPPESDW